MTEIDPAASRIDAAETLPQLIRAIADAYGNATALTLAGDGGVAESLGFAELDCRSAELGRALLASGAGKGSRIGIVAANGPFFAVAFAAIGRIGAVAIPISTTIRANELVRVLRQSDVGGLLVQRHVLGTDNARRLADALPELDRADGPDLRLPAVPFLRWIATTGDDLPPAFLPLPDLLARAETVGEALLAAVEAEVHPTDQLVEIYTSGSMALPKGVKHDHGPVLFRTRYLRRMLGPERGQVLPAALPMFWVGGLIMTLLPNLAAGAATACTERTLRNSRMAMGTVLAPEDAAAMAGVRVIWGLGMSETLGPYAYGDELRAPGYPLCAPMDHLADGYEVRVADGQDRPVPPGTIGEIQLRGYPVTPGLHKIPQDRYRTADGFYRTTDLGLFEGARLLFTGRSGDMIKTAGSNVSPAEVEFELQQLDGIYSAYVVGLPDAERGQLVAAAVVARDGSVPDFERIGAELRLRLSSFKVPRAFVAIARDEVPLLPSNKVSRRDLAHLLEERLGRAPIA